MLTHWRRNSIPYAGAMREGNYQPLGIVFSTYGGGFLGSKEATATLATLRQYLELNDVAVIGTFACCGKETGPAGLIDGQRPNIMAEDLSEAEIADIERDPEIYLDADGGQHYGSFFFHTAMNDKPGPRDEAKAKALVADIVEDFFFSHNGERKRSKSQFLSEYVSIS